MCVGETEKAMGGSGGSASQSFSWNSALRFVYKETLKSGIINVFHVQQNSLCLVHNCDPGKLNLTLCNLGNSLNSPTRFLLFGG